MAPLGELRSSKTLAIIVGQTRSKPRMRQGDGASEIILECGDLSPHSKTESRPDRLATPGGGTGP